MAITALFDTPQSAGVGSPTPNSGSFGDPRVEWIIKKIQAAEPEVQKWRKVAKECARFRDGKQLSEEDEKALADEGRPNNAFNSAQKFVRYVSGVERDSPTQLLFNAITLENDQAQLFGDQLGKYYDWALAKSSGNSERARAFEDFLVTGMGWTNTFIDRTRDPAGLVGYERIPPFETLWPNNNKINLGQSYQGCTRWRAWEHEVENEEAKALFNSSLARYLIEAGSSDGKQALQWPSVDKVAYKIPYIETYPLDTQGGSRSGSKKDRSKIMEFQWWDNEAGYLFLDPLDQTEQWMTELEFNEYRMQVEEHFQTTIEDYDRQLGRKWMKAFLLNRRYLLEDPTDLPGKRFSFNCMCTHYDDWDRMWYGFFRVLMDPQKYSNKFFNQMIEAVSKQAKGGAMFEADAFEDDAAAEDFINEYAITGSVQRLAVGGIAKIKEKQQPNIPTAAMTIMEFCIKSMEQVTGLSEASLGMGAVTQAGITLKRRQRAGMVLLSSEFDAEGEFRKEEGYIIKDHLQMLAEAGGDGRLIRVVSYPGQQPGVVMPLSKDPFSLTYDIELDEVERDPNMRQFLMEWIMGPGGQMLMRAGMFSPDWLDVLPFPRSWVLHMKQAMQQKEQQAQQAQAMGLPAPGQRGKTKPLIELQALVRNKDADTLYKQARAAELTAKAQHLRRLGKAEDTSTMLESMGRHLELQRAKQQKDIEAAKGAIDLGQQVTGGGR